MDPERLKELMQHVQRGELGVDEALDALRHLPYSDLGYAVVDHHRELRLGVPEVIFGQNKTAAQIVGIAKRLIESDQRVLITRLDAEKAGVVVEALPGVRYNSTARTATYSSEEITKTTEDRVAVVCAGTSDIGVAEEAIETLGMLGVPVERVYDVGVAGIHRLFGKMEILDRSAVLIVIAGMEGALPSVVGGLSRRPIIAVPTSVGYGAALSGFTALFGMLTGCASGVTVVNIDNGFGAAMAAARILRFRHESESES